MGQSSSAAREYGAAGKAQTGFGELSLSTRDRAVSGQRSAWAYSSGGQDDAERVKVAAATGGRTFTTNQIQSSRVQYIQHYYSEQYIPSFAYSGTHGMWSNLFLYSMMYNATFGYNHWSDPAYQDWYINAQIEANSDARLRAQLDVLKKQVDELRASGKTADPEYMPSGVPAEVAYADDALDIQDTPDQAVAKPGLGLGIWTFVIVFALGVGGALVHFLRPARQRLA